MAIAKFASMICKGPMTVLYFEMNQGETLRFQSCPRKRPVTPSWGTGRFFMNVSGERFWLL